MKDGEKKHNYGLLFAWRGVWFFMVSLFFFARQIEDSSVSGFTQGGPNNLWKQNDRQQEAHVVQFIPIQSLVEVSIGLFLFHVLHKALHDSLRKTFFFVSSALLSMADGLTVLLRRR